MRRSAAATWLQLLRQTQGGVVQAGVPAAVEVTWEGSCSSAAWAPIITSWTGNCAGIPSSWTGSQSHTRSLHSSSPALADDYYAVLGLDKSASDQDIKKAYYARAKQYHPDTNKDNPDAAKHFQDITKAYETLRDPEKRKLYDQVGRERMERMEAGEGPEMGGFGFGDGAGFQASGFRAGGGFGDLAQQIMEQFMRGDPRMAQAFSRVSISPIRISFMDAVTGTTRKVQLGGSGAGTQTVTLDIPAGVESGDHIEVPVKMGKRGQQMQVLVPIMVEPHPYFTRHGNDLHVACEVPVQTALLGGSVKVPTLDGTADLAIPECIQHGHKLRIRGKGIYNAQAGVKGDQYVEVHVVLPKHLSAKQKELLRQFADVADSSKKSAVKSS